MAQERKNALMITLGGIWLTFISAYGMITVGHFVILSISAAAGTFMCLAGLYDIIFSKEED